MRKDNVTGISRSRITKLVHTASCAVTANSVSEHGQEYEKLFDLCRDTVAGNEGNISAVDLGVVIYSYIDNHTVVQKMYDEELTVSVSSDWRYDELTFILKTVLNVEVTE